MNGIHDLGGMHGLGPIQLEPEKPVFHSTWEARVFALNLAMGSWRRWNIDMGRYAREQMDPATYLTTSYYEHWLYGLERLLVDRGFLTREDLGRLPPAVAAASNAPPPLVAAAPRGPDHPTAGALRPADVEPFLENRRGARVDEDVPPKFKVADRVVARDINTPGHTRVPRYVRRRQGVIDRDHGVFIFPDTNALGLGRKPQHVYAVRFTARELWGPGASPRDAVYADLWDDYLEPVDR